MGVGFICALMAGCSAVGSPFGGPDVKVTDPALGQTANISIESVEFLAGVESWEFLYEFCGTEGLGPPDEANTAVIIDLKVTGNEYPSAIVGISNRSNDWFNCTPDGGIFSNSWNLSEHAIEEGRIVSWSTAKDVTSLEDWQLVVEGLVPGVECEAAGEMQPFQQDSRLLCAAGLGGA